MIKICVSGSKGKMGSRIIGLAKADKRFDLTGEFDLDCPAESFIKGCDCLIEFTTPQATMEHLALCEKHKKAMVIGTTGLSDAEKEKIGEASKRIAIVLSPNMSVGVNLLFKMAGDAARVLGAEYRADISEAHHVHKKDSPSGTAKELARIIRSSGPGADISIKSVREGEIVGDHTVTFESAFDKVQLTHSAKTRDIFAKGALEAAFFLSGKSKGLYTMKEVVRLD